MSSTNTPSAMTDEVWAARIAKRWPQKIPEFMLAITDLVFGGVDFLIRFGVYAFHIGLLLAMGVLMVADESATFAQWCAFLQSRSYLLLTLLLTIVFMAARFIASPFDAPGLRNKTLRQDRVRLRRAGLYPPKEVSSS